MSVDSTEFACIKSVTFVEVALVRCFLSLATSCEDPDSLTDSSDLSRRGHKVHKILQLRPADVIEPLSSEPHNGLVS